MRVVRTTDPGEFVGLTAPLVGAAEARNNLFLGILGTLRTQPEVYPVFHLWAAVDGDRPLAAALRTDPYNLVVADAGDEAALEPLLRAVHDDIGEIPGIVANAPLAHLAAERWMALTGASVALEFAEGVFELTEIAEIDRAPGAAREATREDLEILLTWMGAFEVEALAHRPPDGDEHIRHIVESRLGGEDAGLWLWEDAGTPVSLAGYGGRTPTGIRIGPVYTPPERRGHGYATTLTADLSRSLLDDGFRSCFLYTDLSNPTSNAIYERIGYRRVADAFEIQFEPLAGGLAENDS